VRIQTCERAAFRQVDILLFRTNRSLELPRRNNFFRERFEARIAA
jgi:hypothetical protein